MLVLTKVKLVSGSLALLTQDVPEPVIVPICAVLFRCDLVDDLNSVPLANTAVSHWSLDRCERLAKHVDLVRYLNMCFDGRWVQDMICRAAFVPPVRDAELLLGDPIDRLLQVRRRGVNAATVDLIVVESEGSAWLLRG